MRIELTKEESPKISWRYKSSHAREWNAHNIRLMKHEASCSASSSTDHKTPTQCSASPWKTYTQIQHTNSAIRWQAKKKELESFHFVGTIRRGMALMILIARKTSWCAAVPSCAVSLAISSGSDTAYTTSASWMELWGLKSSAKAEFASFAQFVSENWSKTWSSTQQNASRSWWKSVRSLASLRKLPFTANF